MIDQIISQIPRFFTYYNMLFFLQAMFNTFALALVGCVIGLLVGFAMALARRARRPVLLPLRAFSWAFVEVFRRVPFLVTLMIVFFTANILKLGVPIFGVALFAVVLVATAYLSEIIRGGIDSVHRNQWDAALAMNFSTGACLRYVIMPQAWRVILPPAISFMVLYIKDTALASQIGTIELTYAGKVFNTRGFSPILTFSTVLLLYFALCFPLTLLGAKLEKRFAAARNK